LLGFAWRAWLHLFVLEFGLAVRNVSQSCLLCEFSSTELTQDAVIFFLIRRIRGTSMHTSSSLCWGLIGNRSTYSLPQLHTLQFPFRNLASRHLLLCSGRFLFLIHLTSVGILLNPNTSSISGFPMISSIVLFPFLNENFLTNLFMLPDCLIIKFPAAVRTLMETAHIPILIRLRALIELWTLVSRLLIKLLWCFVFCHWWWGSIRLLTRQILLLRNLLFYWTVLDRLFML